jgi:carbonic anhydrase/acetyltransferase-like protein (isoleucine patch superfamily)
MNIPYRGREPQVASSAWLAPNASLIGDVQLHDDVSVWFGAVLRGDNDRITVRARSNVQDGCVLHVDAGQPLNIGRGVSLGHRAVLHGCHIEDDVLVGMGAIVMNGAHIGAGSIIGAGAVISSGMAIPARSVVHGVPGRTRGEVTDHQLAETKRNAMEYIELALRMRLAF